MSATEHAFDDLARLARSSGFSGAIRLDLGPDTVFEHAFGQAHRALGVANTVDTRFAMASGSKGFTAVAAMSLVHDGHLTLDTTARSLLGDDLPLIDDGVTLEHLLTHRSGIGDYLDEDVVDSDDVMFSVGMLVTTDDFLPLLAGHPTKFAPGERFSYCNGAFVVLAMLIERATGQPFHDVVQERVFGPAGMSATGFLRSDELPGDAALGYIDDGPRTNVFHLPARANGDGGAYTTVADMRRFWDALMAGRLLPASVVEQMTAPTTVAADDERDYGIGLWLDPGHHEVGLVGFDAGATFASGRGHDDAFTYTIVTNTGRGAWAMRSALLELLDTVLPT
jgi:CubicO group peptidase (beta-lactamase class C family)